MASANTATHPVPAVPHPRRGAGRRGPVRNAITLLVRELLTFSPVKVADAATVTEGVPVDLIASLHGTGIGEVARLSSLCRAITASTGFDFRAWPALCQRYGRDTGRITAEILGHGRAVVA